MIASIRHNIINITHTHTPVGIMLGKGEFAVLISRKRLAERLTTNNCSFISDAASSQDQIPEKAVQTKTAAFQNCFISEYPKVGFQAGMEDEGHNIQ